MTSWIEATAVGKIDTRTYSCTLYDDWCIGTGEQVMVVFMYTQDTDVPSSQRRLCDRMHS